MKENIAELEKLMTQRMEAIEKAVSVAHEDLVRVPTAMDKAIGNLREVVDGKLDTIYEKLTGVGTQFRERDVRVAQTALDTKTAVDAALAAQKELANKQAESFGLSIGKSEAAVTKQIDQLGVIIQQNTKASDDKIADIKERLTRIEGAGKGRGEMWGWLIGAVGLLAAIIALFWKR